MYYDKDAEWRLLSSLMANPESLHIITPALFSDERKDILLAMKDAYVRYGECSYEVMRMALAGDVPAQMLVQVNVNQQAVIDELGFIGRRRQLFEAAKALDFESRQYYPNEEKIEGALNFAPILQSHDTTLVPGAQRMLGDLNQKIDGTYKFTHTGIKFLDTMLGGEWLPKTLNIIMAKPGTGKTALIGQSMLEMARQYSTRSLFFSLEMSKEQLISRWVAYLLKMDASNLQFGRVNKEQADKIEQAVMYLQSLPMSVIDDPTIGLSTIRKEIRDSARVGCKVVFLDYLQIVRHSPTSNRNNDLGEVAQTLKEAAKEANIAIVLLSQMTKGREGLDAVRDSGEVAQVADAVIEMAPIDDVPDDAGNRAISLKFHKNRNGKLGVSTVIFNGSTQKFSSQQADY
jgi:replicative DNA helicase